MYRHVAPHAWSPLNFHHSEHEAKATGEFKRVLNLGPFASLNIELHRAINSVPFGVE
jgi:hypothetical protein